MTPEEQRIAIAEACGWELKSDELGPMWSWQNEFLTHRIKWVTHKEMASQGVLPDYLNDLNAMHSAEEVILKQGLQDCWSDTIVEVVAGKNIHWSDYHCFPQVTRATATQRAESFLRTIGKWVSE